MLPSPLGGRRVGDEGVVYACPHPQHLSQLREMKIRPVLKWLEMRAGQEKEDWGTVLRSPQPKRNDHEQPDVAPQLVHL